MSLALRKSVAAYLSATASIDFAADPVRRGINQAMRADSALVNSTADTGSEPAWMIDDSVSTPFVTAVGTSTYVGLTWGTTLRLDALRYYWPAGSTAPTVKLQTWNGSTWSDETGVPTHALAVGWNTLRLVTSQYARGIRVVYVSGGAADQMRCSEIGAYSDCRIEARPSDFGAGGYRVLHAGLELEQLDPASGAVVTIGEAMMDIETGELGPFSQIERAMIFVGLHCASEEQADLHRRWAQLALDAATAPDRNGTILSGIPLRGIEHSLVPVAGGDWWSSGQPEWFTSPAPVVRVAGTIVTPDAIDYGRGRVQLVGVSDSANVRASFTCGIWPFSVSSATPAVPEAPEQILHRHNVYLALEADGFYRPIERAIA